MEASDFARSRAIPPVRAVMTPFPFFVEAHAAVSDAEHLMREHGIRHVPVQQDGELVGIVTQRDVQRLVNPALPQSDHGRIRVGHLCNRDLLAVEDSEPLDRVLDAMADRGLGSALVVRRGKLAGVLTVTDVCRRWAEWLRARAEEPPDEVA